VKIVALKEVKHLIVARARDGALVLVGMSDEETRARSPRAWCRENGLRYAGWFKSREDE